MRQHVLDVRGLDEFKAAALDERNIAALQLELEIKRMETRAEQHCDVVKRDALLAQLQDSLRDEARLHMLVLRAHQQRAKLAAALGEERLGVALRGARDHLVGDIEDALQRAIVLLELDDLGAGEESRKGQDVAKVRAAKRIDRLR